MRVEIKHVNEERGELVVKVFNDFDLKPFLDNEWKGRLFGYLDPWKDGTTTDKQRKHWWALIRDVSEFTGEMDWQVVLRMKYLYMTIHDKTVEPSMAHNRMDKADARRLIQTVIDYAIDNDIPLKGEYRPYFETVQLFKLTMKRQCWICGKSADIHHQENLVGMGRDRKQVDHTKSKFLALCREHHQEAHTLGLESFANKYHIQPIELSQDNLKELGI